MKDLVHARVVDHLTRLRLGHVATRVDALLSDAAKKDVTYLDFLDGLLAEEVASKQRKRIAMRVQIAHFPVVKTSSSPPTRSSRSGAPSSATTFSLPPSSIASCTTHTP